MHQSKKSGNASGTSLLELTIALFIASVVVSGAYQTYRFVSDSTLREKQKAELQRDIITLSNLLERDIRMAGCNLPGNGVSTLLVDTADYCLSCYANETGSRTALAKSASSSDTWIVVADCAGFAVNGYVCLAEDNRDTIYRKVVRIGVEGGGFDTLQLSRSIYHCNFSAGAPAYPATKVSYLVAAGPPPQIRRMRNNVSATLGGTLDSILVRLADASGNPVGAATDNATTITVVIGGHVGKGANRVFLADSTEVNIRNVN